jgi:hypothetical protein
LVLVAHPARVRLARARPIAAIILVMLLLRHYCWISKGNDFTG